MRFDFHKKVNFQKLLEAVTSSDNVCCSFFFQNNFSDPPSKLKAKKKLSIQNPQTLTAHVMLRCWDLILKIIVSLEFSKFFGNNDLALLLMECLC